MLPILYLRVARATLVKSDHDMLTWYIVQSFYSDARLQRIVFYLKEVMPSVPYRSV